MSINFCHQARGVPKYHATKALESKLKDDNEALSVYKIGRTTGVTAAVIDENGTAVGMLFARGFDALCRTYVMPVEEMLEHMAATLAADSPSVHVDLV